MTGEWTPDRLSDRFDDINRRFEVVEKDVRVIAPLVGQMGGAEADIDGLQRDVGSLHTVFNKLRDDVLDLVKHNRAEQLKYLAYIIGPTVFMVGAIFLTGKGP